MFSRKFQVFLVISLTVFSFLFLGIKIAYSQTGCVVVSPLIPINVCDLIIEYLPRYWDERQPVETTFASCEAYSQWETTAGSTFGGFVGQLELRTPIPKPTEFLPDMYLFEGLNIVPIRKSFIQLIAPTWPNMTEFQQQEVDRKYAAVMEHERGHANMLGWIGFELREKTFTVEASSASLAKKVLQNTTIPLYVAEADAMEDAYDLITGHGTFQDMVGGTNIPHVRCSPDLAILPDSLPEGLKGQAYVQQLELKSLEENNYSIKQPILWSVKSGSLPPGVELGISNGEISGTPTQAGTFTFAITAMDGNGYGAENNYSIVVNNVLVVPQITQDEVLLSVPFPVYTSDPTPIQNIWSVYQSWDSGFQTATGSFLNGEAINTVSIIVPQGSNATLIMPGVVRNGTTWVKADNPGVIPDHWEIQVAVSELEVSRPWPRYINIAFDGPSSTVGISTPLVWWDTLSTRRASSRSLSVTGYVFYCYTEDNQYYTNYLESDFQLVGARFFFGDGDAIGFDPGYQDWWNGLDTTQVSFIPVGTVNGYDIRATSSGCDFPADWSIINYDFTYQCDDINVFASYKNDMYIKAPYTWHVGVTECTTMDMWDQVNLITQQWLAVGPPAMPASLIDEVYFKRDYLSDELNVFTNLGVLPVDYTVRMSVNNP